MTLAEKREARKLRRKLKAQRRQQAKRLQAVQDQKAVIGNSRLKNKALNAGMEVARTRVLNAYPSHVLASITMPHDYPAIRFSDMYTGRPTAVANPFSVMNIDYSNPGAANGYPNGVSVNFVTRDPLRWLGYTVPNGAALSYTYDSVFNAILGVGLSNSFILKGGDITENVPFLWFTDAFSGDTGHLHPHGDILYCGEHLGRRGVWLNRNDRITFNFVVDAGTPTIGNTTGNLMRLDGTNWINSQTAVGSVSTISFLISQYGYYAVDLVNRDTVGDVWSISVTIASSDNTENSFGWLPIPFLVSKMASISAIRMIGVAALMTNTAADLYRGGEISMAQTPNSVNFARYLGDVGFTALSSDANSTTMDFKTGGYGFLKPTRTGDMEMQTVFTADVSNAVNGAVFSLIPKYDYLTIMTTVNAVVSGASATYPGGMAVFTPCCAVEFETSDVWYVLDTPGYRSDLYETAYEMLKTMGKKQFFENPIHWGAITDFIRNAAKTVMGYAPKIASLVSELNPELAPIALPVGAALKAGSKLL